MGLFDRWSEPADDGGDEGSPFAGRGFVASAIVVGALVVCALVWVFSRSDGEPSQTTRPPVTTATPTATPTRDPVATPEPTRTPTTTPTAAPTAGGCRNPHPDRNLPLAAPRDVTWTFDGGLMIPLQPAGAGPSTTDSDGIRRCYAHSPTGAVLAAMVTLGQIRNPQLTEQMIKRRVAPGPGRNAALGPARSVTTTPRTDDGLPVQFAGFKFIDYTGNRAIVSIAVRVDPRSVGSLPVKLAWSGGDWKLVLAPDGSINGNTAPDQLASLDGYIRFGGA